MAVECERCGGLTMAETVITLRRRIFGFHETRSHAAYCASCKLSVPTQPHAFTPSPVALSHRSRPMCSGVWSLWRRTSPTRPSRVRWA
jgi:hypothetical protein